MGRFLGQLKMGKPFGSEFRCTQEYNSYQGSPANSYMIISLQFREEFKY